MKKILIISILLINFCSQLLPAAFDSLPNEIKFTLLQNLTSKGAGQDTFLDIKNVKALGRFQMTSKDAHIFTTDGQLTNWLSFSEKSYLNPSSMSYCSQDQYLELMNALREQPINDAAQICQRTSQFVTSNHPWYNDILIRAIHASHVPLFLSSKKLLQISFPQPMLYDYFLNNSNPIISWLRSEASLRLNGARDAADLYRQKKSNNDYSHDAQNVLDRLEKDALTIYQITLGNLV